MHVTDLYCSLHFASAFVAFTSMPSLCVAIFILMLPLLLNKDLYIM